MYPFIETIRIEDGQIYNLDYHTERFNKTRAAFWKDSTPLDLREFISPPTLNGIHKCRIVYGKEVEEVTYAPYQMRQVSSLHLVVSDTFCFISLYSFSTSLWLVIPPPLLKYILPPSCSTKRIITALSRSLPSK